MMLLFLCNLCLYKPTVLQQEHNDFFFWHQPVELGDDLANSFGSASGGRDDVLAGTTAVPPQLAGGAVHGLLSGSDGMDRALMDNVRREAVKSGLPVPPPPPSHPAHILMSYMLFIIWLPGLVSISQTDWFSGGVFSSSPSGPQRFQSCRG